MEEQRLRSSNSISSATPPLLHTLKHARRTAFNRAFAAVYTCAISAMLYYHALKLMHSAATLSSSFFISLSFFLSDAFLAFMWVSRQCFCQAVLALCKQIMENQKKGKKERRREEKEKSYSLCYCVFNR
jgi:hypothetical protein